MFEQLQQEEKGQKEERNKLLLMTALIVGALAIVGAVVYISSRGHGKTSPPVQPVAAAPQPQTAPDPVRDLRIIHAAMGKDPSGLRVMWSIQLKNRSAVYTYSDIQYDAFFLAVDGRRLAENRDTIKTSIAPGEEQKIPPFFDGVYSANYSTYQFIILGAKSAAQ